MKDDELSTILHKTRDYFGFIKSNLSKRAIALRDDDSVALEKIEAYLQGLGNEVDSWNHLKPSEHKSILSKCFRCLQHLDRIAKEYKLFQNGSSEW